MVAKDTMTVTAGRERAAANWQRAVKAAAHQAHDAASGWQTDGAKKAAAAREAARSVRVCVLVRRACGMPCDARVYTKVACSGQVHHTEHVTGVSNPVWQAMCMFDVTDVAQAHMVFQCKDHKHMSLRNDTLGRAVLPLSRVCADPGHFSEPRRLDLSSDGGFFGARRDGPAGRQLEVQVFMSSHGELADMAATGAGALSVLAATWNVGNALPAAPDQLASLWLRRDLTKGGPHLVAVAAQECSYLKEARASRGGSGARWLSGALTPTLEQADAGGGAAHDADGAAQRDGGAGVDGTGGRALESPAFLMRAAAAGAREAPDNTVDDDDYEEEPPVGPRQRMSRAKSLKGLISGSLDSGSAWETHIGAALGPGYWLVAARHMFQVRVLLYARLDVMPFITDVWTGFEATGIGRVGLNKGGVCISLKVGATSLAFVGSHLAAHQSQCSRRNHDVGEIIEELLPANLGRGNIPTGPDHVVWMGDLNYRLDYGQQATTLAETPTPEDHAGIVKAIQNAAYGDLLACDQLRREMAASRVFVGFSEAPIDFPPTFKVVKGSPGVVYGEKRSPAWCDRVLVRSNLPHKPVVPGVYYCCDTVATSDHKPVAALLSMPLVTPPNRVRHRPRTFRLYLNTACVADDASWAALGQAVAKRAAVSGGKALKLVLSGPAIGGGHKDQAINLAMARLQAGYAAASATAETSKDATAEARYAHARTVSLLPGEASVLLHPTDQANLRDTKLVVRLVLQEGLCHQQTIALGVLPLQPAVDNYAERIFTPASHNVTLETPQGVRLGDLVIRTQVFTPVRTRGIVTEAVRRMRLLASSTGFAPGPQRRTVSTSAAVPKKPRAAAAAKSPVSFPA